MANGLLDMLGGALGTTPPSYMEGLLGAQATEDLRKRSIGSGIVNALVGYAAMPKNQNLGLGRILAGAAQAGMQGARGVYDTALQDYQTQAKIAEMKRQQAIQDRELQRQTETEKLAPQLFQTVPAQYREVDGSPYFIPKPAEEGAIAPEYGMQRVIPEPTQELVSPARTTLNMDVAQRIASLSKDPLAAYKNIAETVPALRKAGMIQMQGQQDNPFEIFSTGAQSPTVQKLAQKYQTSYANGTLDQETAEKRILELGKMDETYIDRVARGEDRDLAREQNAANQSIARGIAMGNLALRQDMQQSRIDEKQRKADEKLEAKTMAQEDLGVSIESLREDYLALKSSGGIIDKNKSFKDNVGAYLSSSAVGQTAGRMLGTSNQSIRNSILQKRPLLLNLIKNATGMSAKQMDSNAELKMYLMAATDPQLDIDANLNALDNLERLFIKNPSMRGGSNSAPQTFYDEKDPRFVNLPKGSIFIDGNTGKTMKK